MNRSHVQSLMEDGEFRTVVYKTTDLRKLEPGMKPPSSVRQLSGIVEARPYILAITTARYGVAKIPYALILDIL